MYRYVALSWNDEDLAATAAAGRLASRILSSASGWQSVYDRPGLRVFQAARGGGARRAYVLKGDAGVILGKLFARGASPSDPELDDTESQRIAASQGRRLVNRYWGHYVAFLEEPAGDRRCVLRDPSGGLPCYTTRVNGLDLYFSDMEDCAALDLVPFAADWNHLTAFFLYSELNTRSTGLDKVTQVHAGECVVIGRNARRGAADRAFHWDPVEISEAAAVEDPNEARAALGDAVRSSVDAWASSYDSIVQEVSGGLDSSVVAACVGRCASRPRVLGFHFYADTASGDDRPYARAAAQAARIELVESECRPDSTSLEHQLDPLRVASPSVLGFLPPSEYLRRRLAGERRAGAVFTGQGGDHLFQQVASKLIAAEHVRRHGLGPGLGRVVADTSRLTQASVWSVFASAIAHGMRWRRFDPYIGYDEAPAILSAEARAAVDRRAYSHPWVRRADRLPASKTQQVFNVVDCQTMYLRPCPYAELIHPLISQPIVELCLQIPGYVLAHEGKSRGLLREAFAAELPAEIVNRYSKGSTTNYFNRMLSDNAPFLRELLLDGALAKKGILDRRELERELSEESLVQGANLRPLLDAVRAEAWFNAWTGERPRAAA